MTLWHQLYVTHCLKEFSCDSKEGYELRARSPGSEPWSRFARDFPAPTRPDSLRAVAQVDRLPRQLVFLHQPDADALLHSIFLAEDTLNRPNNYFRHALIARNSNEGRVRLSSALAAWGSAQWTTAYGNTASTILDPCRELPSGGLLDQTRLTAFLSAEGQVDAEHQLNSVTIPLRLAALLDREKLIRLVIAGILAIGSPFVAESGMDRLVVHAEPGLLIVLLAWAARLLPEELVQHVTFNTYVSAGTRLREFSKDEKVTTNVIGTYLAAEGGDVEIEPEHTVLVDTFQIARTSGVTDEPWVETLLSAAESPADLAKFHEFARYGSATRTASVSSFREACHLWQDYVLVQTTAAGKPELTKAFLALKDSALGRAVLDRGARASKEYEDCNGCWKNLREVCLAPGAPVNEFLLWLSKEEHLAELRSELFHLLQADRQQEWQSRWNLLQQLVSTDQLWKEFRAIVSKLPVPQILDRRVSQKFCLKLVEIAQELRDDTSDGFQSCVGRLLLAGTSEEFRSILDHLVQTTPDARRARLIALAMGVNLRQHREDRLCTKAMHDRAAEMLLAKENQNLEIRQAFCAWMNTLSDDEERETVLLRTLGDERENLLLYLFWLVESGLDGEANAKTIDELLTRDVQWPEPKATGYEVLDDRDPAALARICRGLPRPGGDRAECGLNLLWRWFLSHLNKGLLLRRGQPQVKAFDRFQLLQRVRSSAGRDAVPGFAALALDQWSQAQSKIGGLRWGLQKVMQLLDAFLLMGIVVAALFLIASIGWFSGKWVASLEFFRTDDGTFHWIAFAMCLGISVLICLLIYVIQGFVGYWYPRPAPETKAGKKTRNKKSLDEMYDEVKPYTS